MRDEEERGDKKRIEKRKRLFSNKQVPRRKGGQGTSYQSGGEGGGEGVKRGCERIPERKQVETGEENENGACGFRRSVLDEDGGGGGGGGGRVIKHKRWPWASIGYPPSGGSGSAQIRASRPGNPESCRRG